MGTSYCARVQVLYPPVSAYGSQHSKWDSVSDWNFGKYYEFSHALSDSALTRDGWPSDAIVRPSEDPYGYSGKRHISGEGLLKLIPVLKSEGDVWAGLLSLAASLEPLFEIWGKDSVRVLIWER